MNFNLVYVHLFDLILLFGLIQYYRKFGYRFLLFGALALALSSALQILEHTNVFASSLLLAAAFDGGGILIYSGLLAMCVAEVARLSFPARLAYAMAATFVVVAAYAVLVGEPGLFAFEAVRLPGLVLLAFSAYALVRHRHPDSIGSLWLSGLMVLAIIVGFSEPFYVADVSVLDEIHVFDDLVHLLIGVSLLMITSERTFLDLVSKDRRIEEYAEERKRLETQFSQAQKLESLGVLAGGIAHDFNNMLTSILGYASLAMKKLPMESEIRKDLYMVMSGARQAVDLTSQMLLYAGKGALEFEAIEISKVVDNMSSLIHSIVPRKIQLVQKLARDLPALRGDHVQLGQVVMNLVANAVDAIEDNTGLIEVSTGLREVDENLVRSCFFAEDKEPGAYLYLRVKDTGIGMNQEQVERIFDPFYSEKQTSRGLGLASLSGIVRQHNGFIRVHSRPGEGSDFTVFFPLVSIEETLEQKPAIVHASGSRRGSVLLADDDVRIRTLMASILESDHFDLTSAEDGKEALRIFEQDPQKFDLLVLDCTMPKMSGGDVYKKVRASGSRLPVVLVSGYHQEQVAQNISADANAYFMKKPFNVDDFLNQVREALAAYS